MSPTGGNPVIHVRLEQDVYEELKAKIPPTEKGRGGGIAHYVRQLIYADLGRGEAPRHAPELSPRRKRKTPEQAE